MNEALCSILCGEREWRYCDQVNRWIAFDADGTGELWCCIEMCFFIAAQLEWKSVPSPPPPEPERVQLAARASGPGGGGRRPRLLGQLELEIRLRKQVAKAVIGSGLPATMNEIFLSDAAFGPKLFTVRIERGDFVAPSGIGFGDRPPRKRYALRLLFDRSPVPPREEWKRPEGGADSNRFWDNVEFAGRPAPELKKKGRTAMNDAGSAGWGWARGLFGWGP